MFRSGVEKKHSQPVSHKQAMAYPSIENLYKHQDVIGKFKQWWALEKVHGTSARVVVRRDCAIAISGTSVSVRLVSGGAEHCEFEQLFDKQQLQQQAEQLFVLGLDAVMAAAVTTPTPTGTATQTPTPRPTPTPSTTQAPAASPTPSHTITIYGEAYGGKVQGMAATYGHALRFVCFDVQFDTHWLCVPLAERVVRKVFHLDFVPFVSIASTIDALNAARDADSELVRRNGAGAGAAQLREGIVVKPAVVTSTGYEMSFLGLPTPGGRAIYKHKRSEFSETATPRELGRRQLSLEQIHLCNNKQQLHQQAVEWVTPMRLHHILDQLHRAHKEVVVVRQTQAAAILKEQCRLSYATVLQAMVEDVRKESSGEIVFSPEVEREIRVVCSRLYQDHLASAQAIKSLANRAL